MAGCMIKGDLLIRTYEYKLIDVIEEFVLLAIREFDLSLPEREEDETDSDYENSCLDSRHDIETDVATLAKDKFKTANSLAESDLPSFFDDLLGEMTWNKLSDLEI